jgi:glutaredoxin 3
MSASSSGEKVELFGTASCPYTAELRDQLIWEGTPFVEYDVEAEPSALARMLSLTGGRRTVPVLVEAGAVRQVGWHGRGCLVGPAASLDSRG